MPHAHLVKVYEFQFEALCIPWVFIKHILTEVIFHAYWLEKHSSF